MKSFRILAGALAVVATVAIAAPRVPAQVNTAQPIIIKAPKQPKTPQVARFQGEVLHADSASIIVRDRKDSRFIRTFTYSPKVRDKMEKVIARGGFQFGDKVEIRFQPGQDVALDIKGKPSRPL